MCCDDVHVFLHDVKKVNIVKTHYIQMPLRWIRELRIRRYQCFMRRVNRLPEALRNNARTLS